MKMNLRGMNLKKVIAIILMAAILTTSGVLASDNTAEAAVINIKVDAFAKALANAIGLQPITGTQKSTYVNALIEKGIIKEGDFTSYTSYLTRTDGAVILNRADEYLYGDTLDADLVNVALEKRISDINKIKESKRIDVVKCYLKGYIKGFSNGDYSTDRAWKGSSKLSKAGALNCIKMLKIPSLREKISPDGQLIRTTKLPKNAKLYPYILASYPNRYYEKGLAYEGVTRTKNGKDFPLVSLVDYYAPVDIDKLTEYDFATAKKKYLDTWVGKVKTHFELIFNVDYRTIGDEWLEAVTATDSYYAHGSMIDLTTKKLGKYIEGMKANKTIVETSKVAVDASSLYSYEGSYYFKVYVKYRIVSSAIPSTTDIETYLSEKPYNKLVYSRSIVDLSGFTLGKWKEACFNVALDEPTLTDGSGIGVSVTDLNVFLK